MPSTRATKYPNIKYADNPSLPLKVTTTPASKIWAFNKTFRIVFLNGTTNQKDKVKDVAKAWRQAIPLIKFQFVENSIHGDVRIAFDDDVIKGKSWSEVGQDSILATVYPETTHLCEILDTPVASITEHEVIIIEHEFGHILGLQFAPNALALPKPQGLEDWRKVVDWYNFMGDVKIDVDTTQQDAYGPPPTPSSSILATDVGHPIMQPKLKSDSVMVFDWQNKISANDLSVISELYPFPVSAIAFGIQDAFDRSLTGVDIDMVLYAVSIENTLHKNARVIKKDKATSKPGVTWTGWKSVTEVQDKIQLLNKNPGDKFQVLALVALELSDRQEFFLACDDGLLYTNAEKNGTWLHTAWQPVLHGKNPQKLLNANYGKTASLSLEPTTVLRAVEVEGGFNVFFITDKGVLGTIFRKANEDDVPNAFHPVSGGTHMISITSARIGVPMITNPPRIVATTATDVLFSHASRSKQSWSLEKSGVIEPDSKIVRLATGMASTTQHILIIDDAGQLHQNMNKDGWTSWDDGFNSIKMPEEGGKPATFVSISVGVINSNDKEDGYLYVFAVSNNGNLWVTKVDDEGNWSDWGNDVNNIGGGTNKPVQAPKNIKRVITKRTRCGDLEVFVFAEAPNNSAYNLIYELNFNYEGLSTVSQNNGFQPTAWWNPQVVYKN
jgi:hypothetical protein